MRNAYDKKAVHRGPQGRGKVSRFGQKETARGGRAERPYDPFLDHLHELRGEVGRRIDPQNPARDTAVVMRAYELPTGFSKGVQAAARHVAERLADPGRRLDLRGRFIFTCDPETAKDFDDALSLERDERGRRVLGVHIADVSHFVVPGSELDREAARRSTSVYLVDRVVPMLPEALCNGVCSLVPGEDRLAFSVFLTFDKDGLCVARRFAKSVIRSRARFTYEQVMAALDKKPDSGVAGEALKTVREVSRLAQQMRRRRFAAGALDMAVPEAEVCLDANGEMTGVAVRPYDASHQMVEECMVAANEAVAAELWPRGVRILARLHEAPAPEKLEELRAGLARLGVSCGDLSQPKNMAAFLRKIKGHPLEGTLSVMVLRAMKRAVYSAKDIGHFGLAKTYYAHFTSPIRRYPDLTLHRQLAAFLEGRGGREDRDWLANTARWCSEREQLADDAERTLSTVKKLRYMERERGPFDAVVSKCTKFGVFVDVPAFAAGGMVHVSKLSSRYVRYDEFRACLTDGPRTWQTGDRMKVMLLGVDYKQMWADFEPYGAS